MAEVPVFYKRKLIGYYDGEILGFDFVILAGQVPIENAPEITASILVMANVLYDDANQKAGLECYWIENLEHIPGYRPKPARERLSGKQLKLFED